MRCVKMTHLAWKSRTRAVAGATVQAVFRRFSGCLTGGIVCAYNRPQRLQPEKDHVKRFVLCAVMVSALALAILALLCRRAPLQSAAPTQWLSAPPSPKATTAAAASAPGPGRKLPPSVITNPVPSAMMGAAEPEGPLADFTAFAKWAEQFVAGNASASSARGQALAWKRRQAMLELIETDPGKALSLTVPFGWRSALPASVTRYFEQWVDGRGSLDVLVGTDFERGKVTVYREAQIGQKRYKAFVYGARKSQVSQTRTPLHGIALDDKLALQSDPLRILGAAEAEALEKERGKAADQICGVSGLQADVRQQRVAAEIGGEVRYFCGPDHARLVNDQWLAAAGGSGAGAGPFAASGGSDWTHGPKTLLYMRVNFPDDLTEPISEAGAYKVMDGVNDYYTEGSYNMTAITATVTPLMTLPNTKPWYSTAGPGALLSDAREAARHAGFETGNYDRDIACFTTVPTYTFGGLAFVGGKGVWLQSTGVGVTSHELGHNYGLWHANFWNATNSIIGPGTNYEYGNIFDTMGSGGVAQFNAVHKNILNWLPDTAVHNVTSNGVYRIYTYDVPTRVEGRFYAAKVKKDFERDYWLEFRHSYISNPWLQNGVLLNWAPRPESNGGTHLLDTTPGTLADRDDAAVVVGRTFIGPAGGRNITPLGRGEPVGAGGDDPGAGAARRGNHQPAPPRADAAAAGPSAGGGSALDRDGVVSRDRPRRGARGTAGSGDGGDSGRLGGRRVTGSAGGGGHQAALPATHHLHERGGDARIVDRPRPRLDLVERRLPIVGGPVAALRAERIVRAAHRDDAADVVEVLVKPAGGVAEAVGAEVVLVGHPGGGLGAWPTGP